MILTKNSYFIKRVSAVAKNKQEIYDIAIIGGGIAGAGIARDASLRGIRAVLFEANTFGSGTSSRSSKLIHGGIRYLELSWNALCRGAFGEAWKNLRFVFLSLKECGTLEKIAPGLVQPIDLIIPIYHSDTRRPITIYLGAILYSLLSLFSGKGRLPKIFTSRKSLLKRLPALSSEGLAGGLLIRDHTTDDLALVKATIASAIKNGAVCFEKTKITAFEYDFEKNTYKILAEGASSGYFYARKLLNATGPWVDKTRELLHDKEYGENMIEPVAGSHITLKKFLPNSVILQAQDGRLFFVINREDQARVGTTEWRCEDPDRVQPTTADIDYLLNSLSKYFPALKFSRADILSSDAAVRPLAKPRKNTRENEISREHEIRVDHSGVIHVLGVKLTDHRRAAEEIVSELVPELRRYNPNIKTKSLTARTPL